MIEDDKAKKIIRDLLDVGAYGVLIDHYDGGKNVDVVWSLQPDKEGEPMSMEECEALTNKYIRAAWRALTPEPFPCGVDEVEFINT